MIYTLDLPDHVAERLETWAAGVGVSVSDILTLGIGAIVRLADTREKDYTAIMVAHVAAEGALNCDECSQRITLRMFDEGRCDNCQAVVYKGRSAEEASGGPRGPSDEP